MGGAATFSATETLRDGRRVEIRALKRDDRDELLAAVGRTSRESLYTRFFSVKRGFTERETDYFVNIDFVDHVALVAETVEAGRSVIVGGARYIVMRPGMAEIAFTVVDEYQRQGVGASLMRHLAGIARSAGIRELIATVLPGNQAMITLFERSGLSMKIAAEPDVVHVALSLDDPAIHPGTPSDSPK